MKDIFICKNCENYNKYKQECGIWLKKVALNDYCDDFEISEEANTNE